MFLTSSVYGPKSNCSAVLLYFVVCFPSLKITISCLPLPYLLQATLLLSHPPFSHTYFIGKIKAVRQEFPYFTFPAKLATFIYTHTFCLLYSYLFTWKIILLKTNIHISSLDSIISHFLKTPLSFGKSLSSGLFTITHKYVLLYKHVLKPFLNSHFPYFLYS